MTIRETASASVEDGRSDGVGWQYLIDLHGCETKELGNLAWVRATMLEAARRAGAKVVGEHFHRFEPHGISGVVVIAESHLAIHIWPERDFAAVDFFTCSSQLRLRSAAAWLATAFRARNQQMRLFGRGGEACCIPRCGDGFAPVQGPADNLYIEKDDPTGGHWFLCNRSVETTQTAFQQVEIMDFEHFGRVLCLDGRLQSAELDEHVYHEALVHPALCAHNDPKRVLIIGGGEGASAREVLKHECVDNVVMVDIDGELVDLARRHLELWHRNCFDDPRFRLQVQDGYAFVRNTDERFDVAVLDVVDSFDGGPAEALFSPEFFRLLKERLLPGGILVVQAMECFLGEVQNHLRVRRNLHGLFRHIRSYVAFVPSYRSMWGYVIATDVNSPNFGSAETIDGVIRSRGLQSRLRFYDGETHRALFALYKDVRGFVGGE